MNHDGGSLLYFLLRPHDWDYVLPIFANLAWITLTPKRRMTDDVLFKSRPAKPVVKCSCVEIVKWRGFKHADGSPYEVAYLYRLSHHPKLGPPTMGESKTRTSLIVRKDLANKRIETLNTIYEWED